MKICDIWRKIINAKTYSKDVSTNRVTTIYTMGQITDNEYRDLVALINSTYEEKEK
ncbi:hypothetical protein U5N28_07820 [Lysinibacillus telephonicus]|uniref:hypothetical protein n=1 Tax=Lysinibacillus telephonicus TaxID=1714840 RepID=UPI00163A46C6|nr:hypothetical protein [Lysinibacillus telephonicus]